jgi:hypothetical protein
MTDLLSAVLDAHGGLDRWRKFGRIAPRVGIGTTVRRR